MVFRVFVSQRRTTTRRNKQKNQSGDLEPKLMQYAANSSRGRSHRPGGGAHHPAAFCLLAGNSRHHP